jgi:hypothetical protein
MMTVRDLIAILQAMPQNLPIYRDDHEWGPQILVSFAEVAEPKRNVFRPDDEHPALAVIIR